MPRIHFGRLTSHKALPTPPRPRLAPARHGPAPAPRGPPPRPGVSTTKGEAAMDSSTSSREAGAREAPRSGEPCETGARRRGVPDGVRVEGAASGGRGGAGPATPGRARTCAPARHHPRSLRGWHVRERAGRVRGPPSPRPETIVQEPEPRGSAAAARGVGR